MPLGEKLTWLEDLDNDALVIQGVDTLINLRVFSSSNLLDHFIVLLRSKAGLQKSLDFKWMGKMFKREILEEILTQT